MHEVNYLIVKVQKKPAYGTFYFQYQGKKTKVSVML